MGNVVPLNVPTVISIADLKYGDVFREYDIELEDPADSEPPEIHLGFKGSTQLVLVLDDIYTGVVQVEVDFDDRVVLISGKRRQDLLEHSRTSLREIILSFASDIDLINLALEPKPRNNNGNK